MPQNSNQQSDGQQVIAKDLNNVMDLMNHEAVSYQKTKVYSQQVRSDDAKQLLDRVCQHHKQNFTCKQRMSAYSTLIAETTCPNLRTMLQDLFVEAAEDQYAIFDFMHKQGWYPVKQAKQEDITQAKEKAEQLKTSLQS